LLIATFTDFGVSGPYLGQVRALLHAQAPGVPVVVLFPDLPAFDVQAAAYLLPAYSQYLPQDSVCLCVVDPGVGSERAAVAVRADGRWYVGPDNGLLSLVMRRASSVAAFEITWRPQALSASFHGRDLFAPVCAGLATGGDVPGRPVDREALQLPGWPEELHRVVYIDHYGNAVTGLRASALPGGSRIEIAGVSCDYRRTFSEARGAAAFWYANANGLVEIAAPGSSAQATLNLAPGQPLRITRP
jgi:S-adenosylmethionine hydrolase